MELSVTGKINHCRHMILAIAGAGSDESTEINIIYLLNLLRKLSSGRIKTICNKLIRSRITYSNEDIWLFTICWQLALDKDEILAII
jgi:hypothetical protein